MGSLAPSESTACTKRSQTFLQSGFFASPAGDPGVEGFSAGVWATGAG